MLRNINTYSKLNTCSELSNVIVWAFLILFYTRNIIICMVEITPIVVVAHFNDGLMIL
jgi:hypothetical protein